MTLKTRIALGLAVLLWASAFVGIRAGLHGYSPEGLALLRYIVASICMVAVYYRLPPNNVATTKDVAGLFVIGAIGIGVYNILLNYGELSISSGMASFIISLSPIVTALLAIIFLGERLHWLIIVGFSISILGVMLIAYGELGGFRWDIGVMYILIATFAGSCYSVLQKPFLKRFHAIEASAYLIWGGTVFLSVYMVKMLNDFTHASLAATLTVVYLGVFPAAIGYYCWAYALKEIAVSRAVSYLYFMPFVATLMGWLYLGEVPQWTSLAGGLLAILGVWFVNRSYVRAAALSK